MMIYSNHYQNDSSNIDIDNPDYAKVLFLFIS